MSGNGLNKENEVSGVPDLPTATYAICQVHSEVTYRVGGFCEKCYAEQSVARIREVDEALDDAVISKLRTLIEQVLASDDDAVVERFLGRLLSRFDRPKHTTVDATLKAVHLHGPVDFGRK